MSERPDVDVVTFGCRLNAVESEAIRRAARAAGHQNLVVFNTCAVTQEAVRQARQAIRRTRRERPGARIVVTGCAAQIDPQGFAEIADIVIETGATSVAQIVAQVIQRLDGINKTCGIPSCTP